MPNYRHLSKSLQDRGLLNLKSADLLELKYLTIDLSFQNVKISLLVVPEMEVASSMLPAFELVRLLIMVLLCFAFDWSVDLML